MLPSVNDYSRSSTDEQQKGIPRAEISSYKQSRRKVIGVTHQTHRLPPRKELSTTQFKGKVLSREELRRRFNERDAERASSNTAPQDVKQQGTSASAPRQPGPVTTGHSAKDENLGRQKTVEFTLMSDPVQARSGQDLVPGEGELDADVRLYEDYDGKVQGVLELSTVHQARQPPIKVRVICLIDVSGSMLLKGDAQGSRSKISILKSMAGDVIDALEDEEDFFGVMTFGQESRVICPLAKVSPSMRIKAKKSVSELDQGGVFSAVTDLSTALEQAVQMLTDAHKDDQRFLYRHSIIIFSDGEVNAGVTIPEQLVRDTREAIRKGFRYPDTLAGDLWVNVSCVTTGANVSTALYLLSKMCGSDAYFFVDGKNSSSSSKSHLEADMLIPLMLRKTACAQTVSITVRGLNGAAIRASECSSEYSVRRKRAGRVSVGKGSRGSDEANAMCYFIHDVPRGGKKNFTVGVDVERVASPDEVFLSVDVQYVTALGAVGEFSKKVRRQEIVPLTSEKPEAMEAVAKTGICALRQIFQDTARSVARFLEEAASSRNDSHDQGDHDAENVAASVSVAVQTGREKVKALDAEVLSKLDAPAAADARCEYQDFSTAIKANLGRLVSPSSGAGGRRSSGKSSSSGRQWQRAKAMSSAVARQLPTVSEVLSKSAVLCPDLGAASAAGGEGLSARMQALSLYVGQVSPLFGAAQLVANSLAEVLESLGPAKSV